MGEAAEKIAESTQAITVAIQRMDTRAVAGVAEKKAYGVGALDIGGLRVTPKTALQALAAAVLLGAALRGGGAAVEMLKALVK